MAIWREEWKKWKRNRGIEQGDRYKYNMMMIMMMMMMTMMTMIVLVVVVMELLNSGYLVGTGAVKTNETTR